MFMRICVLNLLYRFNLKKNLYIVFISLFVYIFKIKIYQSIDNICKMKSSPSMSGTVFPSEGVTDI